MEDNLNNQERFINSTGHSIIQIYKPLNYIIPNNSIQILPPTRKNNHSLMTQIRKLLTFTLSNKVKQLIAQLTLTSKKTLQTVFSEESMAILANSTNLQDAVTQAHQYNIPLLQIVILTSEGEAVIKQKILLSFRIAHVLNQNFVLYGDWDNKHSFLEVIPDKMAGDTVISPRQGIYARKGDEVYAFIPTSKLESTEDESIIQENLIKIRNLYYSKENLSEINESSIYVQSDSQLSPSSSMFGPRRSYHQGENFNDSDEEIVEEAQGNDIN